MSRDQMIEPVPFANPVGRTVRVCLQLSAITAVTLGLCCNSGGNISPHGLAAKFGASTSSQEPNLVRFALDGVSGDVAIVDVAVGGPTTSTDLYGFAFDVVIGDPTVATFVSGSAVPGDALSAFGGTVSAEASMTGNRVFVGVTKLGTPFGNGVSTPRATIVRLSFRVLKAGSTTLSFDGSVSPQDPAGIPEALDSTGNVVASIVFDAAPASITGR